MYYDNARLEMDDGNVNLYGWTEKYILPQNGIKWQLKQMQQQGLTHRVGPDKGGHWEIVEK